MENETASPDAPAPIGHNEPPEPTPAVVFDLEAVRHVVEGQLFDPRQLAEASFLERLRARIIGRHKAVFDRMDELAVSFKTFPDAFPNDEINGQAQDLFKMMRTVRSRAEEFRKLETDPYRTIRSMIDEIFATPSDAVKALQESLKTRIDKYLEDKKEREKIAREAQAKRERDEADRRIADAAAAEAREAEQRRLAAVAAKEQREANERKEAAERAARAALERKRRIEKITPYLQRRAVREADRRKLAAEERARLAQEAETRRLAAIAAAEAERTAQKATASAARKDETAAKNEKTDALEAAEDAQIDQRVELAGAIKQDKRADRADRRANASSAELSRTRGRFGTVGSLVTAWKVVSVDHSTVDLARLREHLNPEAIDAAVWKYMNLHRHTPGGPVLTGAVFEQVEESRMV